jgi:hypothetical protein
MPRAGERHRTANAGAGAGDRDHTTGELGGSGNVITRLEH